MIDKTMFANNLRQSKMNLKKTMQQASLMFAALLLASTAHAAQLTASVDRDTIGLQETLSLTISADEQTRKDPDLSQLKNDFDILGNSRSQSIRVINGDTESTTEWHITLAPKHAGTLLIPSFNVDNAVSDAIEIHVNKQSQTQTANDDQVQVAIEVSKKSVFVQEQILVKIKLITQVNLSQADLQPLELKNALVVSLDQPQQQRQYQANINGKPHLVVETNYAIFPQESGEITIPSLTYSVAVASMRDPWGDPFGRSRNNILRLRTEEQQITVKPAAPENTGKNWQPSTKVTLNEGWSGSIDQLKVGEPITRTITITADGLTGNQIAPTNIANVDGLTFYPDQAQTKEDKSSKGVKGYRTETMAIIPNHSGTFTLPEVTVNWWDTNTNTQQTATLPAKTLTVSGDANSQAPVAPVIQNNSVTPASTDKNSPPPTPQVVVNTPLWLWITNIIFIVLSLGLIVYVLQLKSKLKELQNEQEQAQEIISEKEKHIWDLLKHAAASKDAATLRKAVLSWANFYWPEQQINSLDEVAKVGNKPELTQSLKYLDELLYSNHPTQDWDASRLLHLLNECRKERNAKKKSEGLKPLYKS